MINLLAKDQEIILQEEPRFYIQGKASYRSLTWRISDAGFGSDFSVVPPAILERACDRGNAVHMACHYYDEGDLDIDSVDEAIKGYVQGYMRFDQECPGKVVAVEQRMVVEIFPGIWIGLTPDCIKFVRGRRAIVERKTSQHLGPGAQLQTMGQFRAWNLLYPKTPVHDRYGLRLQSDGYYKLYAHEDPDDEPALLDCMRYSMAKEKRDVWIPKYGMKR